MRSDTPLHTQSRAQFDAVKHPIVEVPHIHDAIYFMAFGNCAPILHSVRRAAQFAKANQAGIIPTLIKRPKKPRLKPLLRAH